MTMYRRIALAIVTLIALTISIAAQTETPAPKDPQKARPRTTSTDPKNGDRLEPDDAKRTPADVPAEVDANRQDQMSEEDGLSLTTTTSSALIVSGLKTSSR